MKAHLVFLPCIALLSYAVLAGNPAPVPNDSLLALVFCGIAYPAVLFLTWIKWRINGGSEF